MLLVRVLPEFRDGKVVKVLPENKQYKEQILSALIKTQAVEGIKLTSLCFS
jgi:hypothetical protein